MNDENDEIKVEADKFAEFLYEQYKNKSKDNDEKKD